MDAMFWIAEAFFSEAPPNLKTFIFIALNRLRTNFETDFSLKMKLKNQAAKSMEESRIAQPIGTALDRFIKINQEQFAYASGELSQLLRDIALASKVVN